MRRFVTILTLILFSAVLVFAEGKEHGQAGPGQGNDNDDHNDAAPVQSGYAVVTPVVATTSGTTTGLVVFETFGLRGHSDSGTLEAGVLPPDLTTNAILFADESGRLSKNLGVAIVNPNSTSANITLTLRKSDGTTIATSNPPVTVQAYNQVINYVTGLFPNQSLPSDITGTLAITSIATGGTSALPVSVIGVRSRGLNFSTIPVTNLSAAAGPLPTIKPNVGGAGAILLPDFVSGGGYATELIMMNTNATGSLTVRVDLFKADGTPMTATLNGTTASSFTTLAPIPAGGVLTLAPRDKNGDDDF
jgi:hypothetical protein